MKKLIFISLLLMCVGCEDNVTNEKQELQRPDKIIYGMFNEIIIVASSYTNYIGGGQIIFMDSSTAIINDSVKITITHMK